jgi:hypothetical protein
VNHNLHAACQTYESWGAGRYIVKVPMQIVGVSLKQTQLVCSAIRDRRPDMCRLPLSMSFSENQLVVTDEHLFELPSGIRKLDLNGCNKIIDVGLSHLQTLTSLTELGLDDCIEITDVGLSHLQTLSSLTQLGLEDCNKITDVGITSLRVTLPQLTVT